MLVKRYNEKKQKRHKDKKFNFWQNLGGYGEIKILFFNKETRGKTVTKKKAVAIKHDRLRRLKIIKCKQRLKYKSLMRKIFAKLDSTIWNIELVRLAEYNKPEKLLGFTTPWTNTIYIDIRSELILTLVHEALHTVFVEYKEEAILRLERFLKPRITCNDMHRLFRHLMTKKGLKRRHFPLIHASCVP